MNLLKISDPYSFHTFLRSTAAQIIKILDQSIADFTINKDKEPLFQGYDGCKKYVM